MRTLDETTDMARKRLLKSEELVPETHEYALGRIGHNARDKVSDWAVGRGISREIPPPLSIFHDRQNVLT